MQTFDQSLLQLYREELITYETARDAATNADDFDLKVQGHLLDGRDDVGDERRRAAVPARHGRRRRRGRRRAPGRVRPPGPGAPSPRSLTWRPRRPRRPRASARARPPRRAVAAFDLLARKALEPRAISRARLVRRGAPREIAAEIVVPSSRARATWTTTPSPAGGRRPGPARRRVGSRRLTRSSAPRGSPPRWSTPPSTSAFAEVPGARARPRGRPAPAPRPPPDAAGPRARPACATICSGAATPRARSRAVDRACWGPGRSLSDVAPRTPDSAPGIMAP